MYEGQKWDDSLTVLWCDVVWYVKTKCKATNGMWCVMGLYSAYLNLRHLTPVKLFTFVSKIGNWIGCCGLPSCLFSARVSVLKSEGLVSIIFWSKICMSLEGEILTTHSSKGISALSNPRHSLSIFQLSLFSSMLAVLFVFFSVL